MSYNWTSIGAGTFVQNEHVNSILAAIRREATRWSKSISVMSNITDNTVVYASTLNTVRGYLSNWGSYSVTVPVAGNLIVTTTILNLRTALNTINNTCVCNCNYSCTCNCNYSCTCNCDYSCTCNCANSCSCNCNYGAGYSCSCNGHVYCSCNVRSSSGSHVSGSCSSHSSSGRCPSHANYACSAYGTSQSQTWPCSCNCNYTP